MLLGLGIRVPSGHSSSLRTHVAEYWVVQCCVRFGNGATTQSVQSTCIVECMVSILGTTTMIWGSIRQNSIY